MQAHWWPQRYMTASISLSQHSVHTPAGGGSLAQPVAMPRHAWPHEGAVAGVAEEEGRTTRRLSKTLSPRALTWILSAECAGAGTPLAGAAGIVGMRHGDASREDGPTADAVLYG